mgnify:CR=1 FL=1
MKEEIDITKEGKDILIGFNPKVIILLLSLSEIENTVWRMISFKVNWESTIGCLECMVIDISDGQIKLISNDMELAIETIVKGDIIDDQGNKMIAVVRDWEHGLTNDFF